MTGVPVIDASALSGSDAAAQTAVARQIGRARREVGLFTAGGHPAAAAPIQAVLAAAAPLLASGGDMTSPARLPARHAPIRGDAFLLSRLSPTYAASGLAQ